MHRSLIDTVESQLFLKIAFLTFMLARVTLILLVPVEPFSDAAWYLQRALSIASGEGYSESGFPTAFWPVGYPGMLGFLFKIFGGSVFVGQAANLIFAAASFFLVVSITQHLFRSTFAANLAAFLFAVYPNGIAYTALILSEVYFTFLLLLGAYLMLKHCRGLWLVPIGVVFGLRLCSKL